MDNITLDTILNKEVFLSASALKKGQNDGIYKKLDEQGLSLVSSIIGGDGSAEAPQKIRLQFRNTEDTSWEGIIKTELVIKKDNPRFFLPGFMYGRNRGEAPIRVENKYPRIRACAPDCPASPWWMVRSDRLSHPAAFIYDTGKVYGFHTAPYFTLIDNAKQQAIHPSKIYQYGGFTINLEYNESSSAIGYTIGYENAPWHFIQSHTINDREEPGKNCFRLEPGEEVCIELYIYMYSATNELEVNKAIQNVYEFYHEAPRKCSDINTAIRDLSEAVASAAWLEEERGFSGFVRNDPTGGYSYNKIPSLSWTNGLAVAVPVLAAANLNDDVQMRSKAIDCIENILDNSINPSSGIPFDSYKDGKWTVEGWWYDLMYSGGHSAYVTGQAIYYILKAFDIEAQNGHKHDKWLEFVRPVIKRFNIEKNSEGEFPFSFSTETGVGLQYDSFGGVWCLAATAYYMALTNDAELLTETERSTLHYYSKYVTKMVCYGTPLDTDKAPDSEGILAFIRALKFLHMITGKSIYLQYMKDSIDYEFTYKFCYNVPVQVPPLSKVGWSSCGGSITSTANPHIHPMSSSIVGELKYYAEKTGDEYVKSRMMDTILWGCQTYNTYDGEYDFGEKGWMSERFCYSQGLLTETYPDGSPASTWFALMPWASTSIIEGLVDFIQ